MNKRHDVFSSKRQAWVLGGLFASTLAIFLFLHATRQISNPDFWWHLKTGEVISQQGGLLHSDPFTFHEAKEVSRREAIILKGYWLWQVTAYQLYNFLGFKGIFLLNLVTIGAIAACLVRQMFRLRIGLELAVPLLTAGFMLFSSGYSLERPHIVSFLFVIILLGMIARVRQGGNLGPGLPLMMVVWANLHGGFIVGAIVLFCFAVGLMIEHRHELTVAKGLLFWIAAGLLASLFNPNGISVYLETFHFWGASIQTSINEYKSTWAAFSGGITSVAVLWALIFLYWLGVCLLRRIYWPEFLAALFLSYFSVKYSRNVAFFSLAMLPAIGWVWNEVRQKRDWRIPTQIGFLAVGLPTLWLMLSLANQWKQHKFDVPVAQIYPDAAINFLETSGLQGRMFNSYGYGGYLLWKLSPNMKIFIDGRGVDEAVYNDYEKIRLTSLLKINGVNEYEALLDRYKIDFILQPIYDDYGLVQPLMKEIFKNDLWIPIYLDTQTYIIVKKTEWNQGIVKKYGIDKVEFNNRLLLIYDFLLRKFPDEVSFRVARASMLVHLGRYGEAKAEIDAITRVSPNETTLPHLRQELNRLTGSANR